MNKVVDFNHCITVLNGEIELLKRISSMQNSIRQIAMSREWTDFDEKSEELNRLSVEFAALESERAALFSVFNENSTEEKSFYDLITEFPTEQRGELLSLYRELKMETLKMRALNETFLGYLNEAKTLASSYLEAVCPARGGKLYTRKGRRVSQDLRSLVVNNRF